VGTAVVVTVCNGGVSTRVGLMSRLTTATRLFGLFVLLLPLRLFAADSGFFGLPAQWHDWWQTKTQQAEQAWNEGDIESLQNIAPDDDWQGVAAYAQGEYEQASTLFNEPIAGDDSVAASTLTDPNVVRRWFNQATADVQLGQYVEAIKRFDAVLAAQPDHRDASRNKAIAERLLALEQESQANENGEGEDSEKSDKQDGDDQQSGEQSEPQSGESDESDESDDNNTDQENENGEQDSSDPSQDPSAQPESPGDSAPDDEELPEQDEDDVQAAREALAGDGNDEAPPPPPKPQPTPQPTDEPMSEQDQATEQWLRQIPDDPNGFLRRKLMQNHRSEYPTVLESGGGW